MNRKPEKLTFQRDSNPGPGVFDADAGWAFKKILESKDSSDSARMGMFHTSQNLNTLAPDEWLDDEVMNSLFYALYSCNQDRMHYFNPLVYSLLTGHKYDYKTFEGYADDVVLSSKDFIFFIINVDNMHWILAVAVVSTQKILLLDSFGCMSREVRRLEIIKRFLEDCGKHRPAETKLDVNWKLEVVNPGETTFPAQFDGYNCGLHVYAVADRILAQGSATKIFPVSGYNSSSMIQLRKHAKEALEKLSLC